MSSLRLKVSGVVLCGLLGVAAPALAGIVSTEEATASKQVLEAREHVKQMMQRPELAKEMEKLGIAPDQAAGRVDAMTDAEVMEMAAKLDSLPAGGALSNNELILILLIVILILAL